MLAYHHVSFSLPIYVSVTCKCTNTDAATDSARSVACNCICSYICSSICGCICNCIRSCSCICKSFCTCSCIYGKAVAGQQLINSHGVNSHSHSLPHLFLIPSGRAAAACIKSVCFTAAWLIPCAFRVHVSLAMCPGNCLARLNERRQQR